MATPTEETLTPEEAEEFDIWEELQGLATEVNLIHHFNDDSFTDLDKAVAIHAIAYNIYTAMELLKDIAYNEDVKADNKLKVAFKYLADNCEEFVEIYKLQEDNI